MSTTSIVMSAEVILSIASNNRLLELRKSDNDTWLMVLSEKRPDGKELPKEAMTLNGSELRSICANKYLFGGSQ